jgi:hypothetical protein
VFSHHYTALGIADFQLHHVRVPRNLSE